MGQRVLTKVQYGLEGTHGTAVAADTRLMAWCTMPESDREVIIPGAGIGQRVPGLLSAAYVRRVLAEGIRLETPGESGAYYQIFPLLFSLAIKGSISPSEQNSGEGDYLWTFADPLTGSETVDTMTLEMGDGTGANEGYEMAYCAISELEIAGNADSGEVTANATLFGDEVARTQLTDVGTMPTATAVIGKLARVYVDDTWAGLGSNELENALLDFTLSISTGVHPKLRGSSQRTIDSHDQGEMEVTLTLGLERGASGVATEEAYYRATTVTSRFVRLEIDSGIAIGSGDNHKLTLDIAGAWMSWHSLGRDQDGNNIAVATLRAGYDSTGTHAFTFKALTDVASI